MTCEPSTRRLYDKIGKELVAELSAFVAWRRGEFQSQLPIRAAPVGCEFASVSVDAHFSAAYAQPFRISKGGAVPMAQYLAGLSDARAKVVRDGCIGLA